MSQGRSLKLGNFCFEVGNVFLFVLIGNIGDLFAKSYHSLFILRRLRNFALKM